MADKIINVDKIKSRLHELKTSAEPEHAIYAQGVLTKSVGLTLEATGFQAAVGTKCFIHSNSIGTVEAIVTGFSESKFYLMPLTDLSGVELGCKVSTLGQAVSIPVSPTLLGRVLDPSGRALDGKAEINQTQLYPLWSKPMNPLARQRITTPIDMGIKAINGLLTVGRGQRIGLFAGSGVGKSVLLGMIARFAKADVIVVALIGERGREVKEFIEENLGAQGLSRAVIVASPADYSPVLRFQGALAAMSIAEYFRDQGKHVLLLMDSVTRFSQAQREIALAMGEPPATKGYPPSVFKFLPQLIERAGMGVAGQGSITGIFTVLAEGDDHNDPVVDSARAILDGHIVLSRRLADQGHFPAIDVNASISRVMTNIIDTTHKEAALKFRKYYASYEENVDLINIGAYAKGANEDLDFAVENIKHFKEFLHQAVEQNINLPDAINQLKGVVLR